MSTKASAARRATSRRRARPRPRLGADDRRRTLVHAAAALLTARGPDAVQIPEVGAAAGVTRQLVYRFFPNRQALILAVLQDFADELTRNFAAQAARTPPGTVADATRGFVEAVCDTIAAKGAGAWNLLVAPGSDGAVAGLAAAIERGLVAPWLPRIATATGASRREVTALARMIVAGARAVLALWSEGVLTRAEAVRDATRGVNALLAAFTVAGGGPRRR